MDETKVGYLQGLMDRQDGCKRDNIPSRYATDSHETSGWYNGWDAMEWEMRSSATSRYGVDRCSVTCSAEELREELMDD